MKLLKTLTSLTMIFALFSLHIETKAISWSTAYAEEESSEESEPVTVVSDKDPSKPHLDYRESEQKIGKMSKAQMLTTLAMLLGPSIAMACFQPISAKIFAASGVVYLAMEVMNYSKYKKASTSNQEMYATLDPDTTDKQIEAFTYAEEQEKTAAAALGKKAAALNIFFMGMTAAAIMAIIEGVRALIPSQQGSDVCTGTVSLNQSEIEKILYASLSGFSNFILPSASAKESEKISGPFSKMGILAGAAGAILAYKGVAKGILQPALKNGFVRAAVFGAFAGFAFMAKAEVTKAQKKAEENAAVYANLRDQLMRALGGAQQFAGLGGGPNGINRSLPGYAAIRDEFNNPATGSICLIGKLGQQTIDAKCQCAKTNTCSKAEFSSVGLQNQGLPSLFASGIDNLASGANSLFSGNTAAADSAFGNLTQGAAGLRKLHKQMKAKADAQFKKNRSKATMAQLESDLSKRYENAAPGIINSLPPNQRSLATGAGLASLASSGLNSRDLDKAKDGNTEDLLASIKSNAAAIKNQGVAAGLDFNFGDTPEIAQAQIPEEAINKDGLGDFTQSGSDISDRPDDNIFKIITVRYFKSAYPRIFEEDKSQSLE